MSEIVWTTCRLTLIVTFLWVFMALFVFIDEGKGESLQRGCAVHIKHHENLHSIPHGLLYAISKVESGKKDEGGKKAPWPWTINAEGKGYFFPTKQMAVEAVRRLQRAGVKSIDVGCMQVNLHHHPYAFKNLNDAFDPAKNVAYAARFLKNLKKEHTSWMRAVAHYHSANPVHNIPYQKNVLAAWHEAPFQGKSVLTAAIMRERSSSPSVRVLNRLKKLRLASAESAPEISSHVRRPLEGARSSYHLRRISRKTLRLTAS